MVTLLALLACSASGPEDGKEPYGGDDSAADEPDDSGESGGDTARGPFDADADGYLSDVDCDDDDATVHPDAADACDGVDRDCDGAVVDEGGCGEVTEVEDTFPSAFVRDYLFAGVDCVWSTTSGDVIVDHTALEDWSWGGYATYRWTGETFDYALSLTTTASEVYEHCTVVGDFDGDGTDDLAIHGGSPDAMSELALISGDASRWADGLVAIDDAAFAVWGGVQGGDRFSEELAAGDVDGDGLVDIVTHAPADVGEDNGGKSGWLFVIPGRSEGFPTAADVDAVREEWYYPHSRDHVGRTPLDEAFSIEVVHPDLDGDGLADLVGIGQNGSYAVIPGANLVVMQGAYIEDIVDLESVPVADRYTRFRTDDCQDLDFDGDGVGDCYFRAFTEEVTLGIVSGASLAAGLDPLDAALTTAGPITDGDAHLIRDLDGDGLPDIGLDTSDSGTQCVVASSRPEHVKVDETAVSEVQ